MRFFPPLLLIFLLPLTVLANDAPPPSPPPAPPTLEDRLAAGEVVVQTRRVEGFTIPALHVEAVIDAVPERIWAIVDDCNGYRNSMPHVIDSAEVERNGARTLCKWTVDMPFPFSNVDTVIETRSQLTPGRWQREFHQIRGDFVRNEGSWLLVPFGEDGKKTHIVYKLHAVMGTIIPDSMVKRGQINAMHEMIRKMRAMTR